MGRRRRRRKDWRQRWREHKRLFLFTLFYWLGVAIIAIVILLLYVGR